MNKVVGVTKPIYELCKVIEKRELTLVFSCFYSFAEILDSSHFCPGFYFDGVYYEIQYDDENVLKVVDFGIDECKEVGDILTEEQIIVLTENMRNYEK
jgi:hypothetical protein